MGLAGFGEEAALPVQWVFRGLRSRAAGPEVFGTFGFPRTIHR